MRLYGLTNSTPATAEPVTIEEARKQVELPAGYSAHDALLMRLVAAARGRVEMLTGRQIVTATWDLYLDEWPYGCDIVVPKPPLQSVTSITYVDLAGATQTWANTNYVVSTSREPGVVRLAYDKSFPSARYQPDAIRVRYVAGYGTPPSAPEGLKAAILLLVDHWFEHRGEVVIGTITSEVPVAADALIMQYMVGEEFTHYAGVR